MNLGMSGRYASPVFGLINKTIFIGDIDVIPLTSKPGGRKKYGHAALPLEFLLSGDCSAIGRTRRDGCFSRR